MPAAMISGAPIQVVAGGRRSQITQPQNGCAVADQIKGPPFAQRISDPIVEIYRSQASRDDETHHQQGAQQFLTIINKQVL